MPPEFIDLSMPAMAPKSRPSVFDVVASAASTALCPGIGGTAGAL